MEKWRQRERKSVCVRERERERERDGWCEDEKKREKGSEERFEGFSVYHHAIS
jgi:hypothetical protein